LPHPIPILKERTLRNPNEIIGSVWVELTPEQPYVVGSMTVVEFNTDSPIQFGRGTIWAEGNKGQPLRAGPMTTIRPRPTGPSKVCMVGIAYPVEIRKPGRVGQKGKRG
jgi:hypothetical protein